MKSSPTLVESLRKSAEERPLTRYLMNEAADAIEKLTEELQIRSLTADASLHVANAPQVPDGFVLLPMVPNVEMCEVMNDDSWLWEDLLAAAGTITEDQYAELSAPQEHLSVPERMVQFIDHIINGVFEGGDWDGCALQNMAVRYGLLKPVEMQAPCSDEGCQCAQMEADFPVICYRKTYTAQSAPQPEQKG